MRRTIFVAVTLCLAVIVTFGLLEVSLRLLKSHVSALNVLLYSPRTVGDYAEIETLEELLASSPEGFAPFKNWAGFVQNSKSLRTREYTYEKPPGTYRILAIGDSFTHSSGNTPYSQLWHSVLEANLRGGPWGEPEVLNLGVIAIGPMFELRLWQLEGRKLNADLVILALFVGNDFTDNQPPPRATFAERSYAIRLVRNLYRLKDVVEAPEMEHAAEPSVVDQGSPQGGYELREETFAHYRPDQPTFKRSRFLKIVSDTMRMVHPSRSRLFEQRVEALEGLLLEFRDSVESTGARFVVLVMPAEYQIDPDLLEAAASSVKREAGDYLVDLPQQRLAEFFEREGFDYLDLLPDFRRAAETQRLYMFRDTHWNADGNGLAAELLTNYLRGKAFGPGTSAPVPPASPAEN